MVIKDILALVEKETGLDLSVRSRKRELVYYRYVYFKLAREHSYSALSDIGALIGRDHSTVLHGIKVFNDVVSVYEYDVYKIYNKISDICKGRRYISEKYVNPESYYRQKCFRYLSMVRELRNENRELKNKQYV